MAIARAQAPDREAAIAGEIVANRLDSAAREPPASELRAQATRGAGGTRVGEHEVAAGAQHAGDLGRHRADVEPGDEIEMVVGKGQRARAAGLEGDPALGVEADPARRPPDRLRRAIDAADPRARELASQEECPVALAALDLEHALGRTQVEHSSCQRGQRGRWRRHRHDRKADCINLPHVEGQPDRRWIVLGVFAVVAVIVVGAILVSRGGDDSDDGGGNGDTTSASSGEESGGCKKVEAPKPKEVNFPEPEQTVEQGEEVNAVVKTSCGTFTIALDTERAPDTSNSFTFLAEEGFYDDVSFHRIIPEFVVQGGDPTGSGSGGPGYSVDEKPPANLEYTKGIVAMAKTETEPPGRSGSQFYIVTAADAGLPAEYALLGEVSDGYPVVERIERQGTPEGTPKQPVLIESITIERE